MFTPQVEDYIKVTDTNATRAAEANEADAPIETEDMPEVEHTVKRTKDLAQDIRDAIEDTGTCEDVWQEIKVNIPTSPTSMASFTIEGDDGLYYSVQVVPLAEQPD